MPMPRVQDSPDFLDDYPAHKSRPSLTTNASGIAESTLSYASMTTAEGLQRLSQFPPPPAGVPISPFEASLGLPPSPSLGGGYIMTPPATPPTGPVRPSVVAATLPTPPRVFSLPPRRQDQPRRQDSVLSGSSMDSSSTGDTARPLPVPQVYSPVSAPSPLRTLLVTPSGSTPSPLSPHDWHDGSSSIAVDGYEERMLSTSFITSLLTAVDEGPNSQSSPRYKRDHYDASISSDVMSAESTVTYPPRRVFPDPNTDESLRYPLNNPMDPSTSIPTAGRDTPASMHTAESAAGAFGDVHNSNRSLSISTSLQSMTSATPLNQTFPRSETIQEELPDEFTPSTPETSGRKRERRMSAYSSRTTKSYVSSLITRLSHSTNGDRKSIKQAAHWFRKKPLPPVPRLPDMTLTQEVEYRQAEAALPLPDLVDRAKALSRMLDNGHRPYSHNQMTSHPGSNLGHVVLHPDGPVGISSYSDEAVKMSGVAPRPSILRSFPHRRSRSQESKDTTEWCGSRDTQAGGPPRTISRPLVLFKQHKLCVGITLLAIIVLAIVVAVSVTLTRKHRSQPKCSSDLVGASCSINATCVCTVTSEGQCGNKLAQNLVSLVPAVNTLFSTNYTPASLSKAVWLAQGEPGNSCANQARLVDVAPGLDPNAFPNRTQWAQAALLWDLVESSNLTEVLALRKFVAAAPWSELDASDGTTPDLPSSFTASMSGYEFNFAAQTVMAPPVTFLDIGQPSRAQIAQVGDTARSALDRMYTYALASATQQQTALATYWTSVLQKKSSDLNHFLSQIRGSQILLPFDATYSPGSQALSALLTNSSSTPFPPPLACYPGLSPTQLQAVNNFEATVFGLTPTSPASKFDTSCYPSRPIYGVLDISRARLPFMDSRSGLAKQAVVLSTQATGAASRAIVYNGEVLSALPGLTTPPNLTSTVMDPRRFGTMNHLDHVILGYLQSIPDVNVAIALVEFIMNGSPLPPTSDSILFASLTTIPVLEVALFGTINPSDVEFTVSSFSDPAGNLFFGTDQSAFVREWAINAVHSQVQWAQFATSAGVVGDNSFTDAQFNGIWDSAFNFFHVPNKAIVGVGNVTQAFCAVGKLTGCP